MAEHRRYTLPLPDDLYEELKYQSEKHDKTMKEVLRQALRFGLTAMRIDDDPNAEICFKEQLPPDENGEAQVRERILQFVW